MGLVSTKEQQQKNTNTEYKTRETRKEYEKKNEKEKEKEKEKKKKKIPKVNLQQITLPVTNGKLEKLVTKTPWNALVITDLHFTNGERCYFATERIPKTIENIGETIEKHNIQQVIILGDLFHGGCDDLEYCGGIIQQFCDFGVPFYIIGGNHDRSVVKKLSEQINEEQQKLCHFVTESLFMEIEPLSSEEELKEETEISLPENGKLLDLGTYNKIVFSHDAGNNFWLKKEETVPFIRSIRLQHKKYFDKKKFLLIGHTHSIQLFKEELFGSISPFHFGHIGFRSYGLVRQINGKLKLDVIKMTNFK
ncbi:transmembrane protein with metallophosphoesterase domain-related [Anaeramoeba flamelloides]|uniref:Transmembrane protein with metallophosphoesterase domain-related n=1 Tax=Anaeramoeba flamelloides TaxID=1746091 RepID=A0AAV7ZN87_9EUKA|nr:transmembrane protein with metallophosphoesterase domain-related [Anaeramoeba flamelloides]